MNRALLVLPVAHAGVDINHHLHAVEVEKAILSESGAVENGIGGRNDVIRGTLAPPPFDGSIPVKITKHAHHEEFIRPLELCYPMEPFSCRLSHRLLSFG